MNSGRLRNKLISTALASKEFTEELKLAAQEIREEVLGALNEATVEGIFERVVYAILREIGIRFHPHKEVALETRRHIGRGRADSRIGAVVLEFKHPSKLKGSGDVLSAKQQLKEYIISLSARLANEVCGFLTDGLSMYEMLAAYGKIISDSGRCEINSSILLRITKSIVSLEHSALTSKNLIRDFCGNNYDGVLFEAARILHSILSDRPTPKTDMLRSEWEELFRLAHDDQSQQRRIQERRNILSRIFREQLNEAFSEYRALFALHTAYAIVLKMISYRVVSELRFGEVLQDYKSLQACESEAIRAFCSSLEDGEIFRQLHILNLLEGDFFSWYSDTNQWNAKLARAVQEIIQILGRYEDVKDIFASTDAVDLFRELYEGTVPQVVRGSFGEFYTPFWLADHVIETSSPAGRWSLIDPCCGSGTFVIAAIARIRREEKGQPRGKILHEILDRVCAIDLNPLAVLTTRIHYFIHIADLLTGDENDIVIPVFLGDSSYVPEKLKIGAIEYFRYNLQTLRTPILIELPVSLAKNTSKFIQVMQEYEKRIKQRDAENGVNLILASIDEKDIDDGAETRIRKLTQELVELETKGWNGIWARIITNFLTSASLGKFTNVVSNPPWIDWKNLPSGYRDKIKSLCIDRGLFSGAGRTGGINLNICALITHVAATNWLDNSGKLAFLMPKELAYQASYEGWRQSVGGPDRSFLEFHDWSFAGHPFGQSKEDFMTFVIGKAQKKQAAIPVSQYVKKRGVGKKAHEWKDLNEALSNLEIKKCKAGQIVSGSTAYTFGSNNMRLKALSKIAGDCAYIAREGIEFYPQELLIFQYDRPGTTKGTVFVRNIQVEKSKYRIASQQILLETKYLYPLVKGPAIDRFLHNYEGLIVPFPYEAIAPHRPLEVNELDNKSPLLLAYYKKYEQIIKTQTQFSDKIRGPNAGEFYGLARTGAYSFQHVYVAFRDNTKWCAVVIAKTTMPWGGEKRFLFQNHAVSICERKDGSGFIGEEEAHYICAILNSPIVEEFICASSDTRSFKIRPPIFVPKYDGNNSLHTRLSQLSFKAHEAGANVEFVRGEIEKTYLEICGENPA